MALTLHVDAARWRQHLKRYAEPEGTTIVPVAKGNGYGFGNATLAAETAALGAGTLAVGTYEEIADVRPDFSGDLLVLSPWRPWLDVPTDDEQVIHTVSRVEDLRALAERSDRPRVVVEVLTSMRRHGVGVEQLGEIVGAVDRVRFEGIALHLPLNGSQADQARRLGTLALDAMPSSAARTLWVSHLTPQAASALGREINAEVRLRVGSALWLGDRGALSARGTVLDLHRVQRGDRYGYRQRGARRNGWLVVVGGGTAHGVALEAPSPITSLRQRLVTAAKGGLEATGRALSPFRMAGKQRWFAEPPHMQCSMIWLPDDLTPPSPGDELDVEVRFTTTNFDRISWE
ncbi:alanine racemase [Phytoactinopolyspora halotolerans]|uniref:Alanine racemase n=1 Tax=Phytoactinopolyspora halotolerans TaxID=1981512 RepID=A0A6L9S1H6_9ACTN|nr:alanine racemase [Phytoactinopolyspora halotolerans]NED98670.1 alanine racemase [Phytoactinopolyspora halotolerans]